MPLKSPSARSRKRAEMRRKKRMFARIERQRKAENRETSQNGMSRLSSPSSSDAGDEITERPSTKIEEHIADGWEQNVDMQRQLGQGGAEHIDSEASVEIEGIYSGIEISTAEARAISAEVIIKKGQQTRLCRIRNGHWNLYSRDFVNTCESLGLPFNQQSRSLFFRTGDCYIGQRGQKQWRYIAEIVIGEDKICTDPMTIPKYPSSEAVTVLAQLGDSKVFEIMLTFLGVGCVKVYVPSWVVEDAICICNQDRSEADMVQFIGLDQAEGFDA